MTTPTLLLSPLKAAVPARRGTLDVMVRLQAPDKPEHVNTQNVVRRLALVVDRSGSMRGRPLEEVKRCVMHIAGRLTTQDKLGVVFFNNRADVVYPLQAVNSVSKVEQALAGVKIGGNTNLHCGLDAGAQLLESGDDCGISRVVLLSDGCVNHGETFAGFIEAHCQGMQGLGISTTTFGLGQNINEDLMIGMAREGGGQHYAGHSAADLFESLDAELASMQATYLRYIKLKLVPAPGVIVEMVSDVAYNSLDGCYSMSDLTWGGETWLALRLHVTAAAPGSLRDLLAATITGTDMQGNEVAAFAPMLQLPAMLSYAIAAMSAEETLQRRLLELDFAKAARAVRHIVRQGNLAAIDKAMRDIAIRFGDHHWLNDKIVQLHRFAAEDLEMMKEIAFECINKSRSLAGKEEMDCSTDETDFGRCHAASFVRPGSISEAHYVSP
jgi:Ca-activated chloride channel family protein